MSSPPHYHLSISLKHHSAYAPSTRASDISRLLDPSYTSSSRVSTSSSSYSPHQTSVYVDHSGDFHDPDYRDFPIVNISKKPCWEQNWNDRDHIDEEDEDDDDHHHFVRGSRFSAYHTSPSRLSTSRPRSPITSPALTTTSIASSLSPYAHFVSPSPPTSFDEDDDILSSASSPFESEVEHEPREKRKCFRRSIDSKRRKSDSSSIHPAIQITSTTRLSDIASATTSSHSSIHVNGEVVSSKEHVPIVDKEDHTEWTPTCSMALRRQWQAIQLRLSLGVFRVKRRIRRKVGI